MCEREHVKLKTSQKMNFQSKNKNGSIAPLPLIVPFPNITILISHLNITQNF